MIRLTVLLFYALTLVGCTGGGTRPCPGFGTPLADQWSTALNVGDVVNFVSETGATASLELHSRVDSEPYEGYSRFGADEVTCVAESVRQFNFDNSEVTLLVSLDQTGFDIPALEAGQTLTLQIRPESPAGEAVGFDYLFFLTEQTRLRYPAEYDPDGDTEEASPQAGRFIENLQIGNSTYSYVIEQRFEDLTPLTSAVPDVNSFAGIVRLILAEGAGLVEFELQNGEVYSRI